MIHSYLYFQHWCKTT